MRIGFTLVGGRNWTGGRNYLLNLLSTIGEYGDHTISSVLFVGTDVSEVELAPFIAIPHVEIVKDRAFNSGSGRRIALLKALLTGCDNEAANVFKLNRIDVLFEAAQFFGWRLGIPTIAWMPDFQHRRLPHLFPKSAWLKREIGFRAQVYGKRRIMLSSEDAKHDCERLYPSTRNRTHTVSFATLPTTPISLSESRAVADHYSLGHSFFFLPNQFWAHKNHKLIIEALALLKQRGHLVTVAASGNPADPRSPEHFQNLVDLVAELGLEDNFRILGLIPYEHISALMQSCSALINPSLFEGWSTVVEEARLLGTPMILSDLDVHKEQMGSRATYFDRHSPEALAQCLEHFVEQTEETRRTALAQAQDDGKNRSKNFADAFKSLVSSCKTQKQNS
jgi:glycosyltransferase involved in cell wall biosynthesis